MSKTYANKQNATRAAKKFFGALAQPGFDYRVFETAEGFTFESLFNEAAAQEAEADTAAPKAQALDKGADFGAHVDAFYKAEALRIDREMDAQTADEAPVSRADFPLATTWRNLCLDLFSANLNSVQVEAIRSALTTAYTIGGLDAERGAMKVAKPAKAPRAPKAPREKVAAPAGHNKRSLVADLLLRPEGCTTADILAATGWPTVSVPQQAKASGLVLRKEKFAGQPTRYFGAPAVAEAA